MVMLEIVIINSDFDNLKKITLVNYTKYIIKTKTKFGLDITTQKTKAN